MEVDHIDIQIYGANKYPIAHLRIPGHLVNNKYGYFDKLLAQAQSLNPLYDAGRLVRWMLRIGHLGVASILRQRRTALPLDDEPLRRVDKPETLPPGYRVRTGLKKRQIP